jgi:predicted peptidase
MKPHRLLVALVLLLLATATIAFAQARDTVNGLRSRYNTVKSRTKPEGELKRQIESLDAEIAKAYKLGRSGEIRRLYAKGFALMGGQAWTAELDFASSLALRSERVFVDAAQPVSLRLEQIYSPVIELTAPLTVSISLYEAKLPPGAGVVVGNKLKDAETYTQVSRDLLDEPFRFDLNLADVADGLLVIRAEVMDGTRALGTANLMVDVRRGLNERLRKLESDWARVKGSDVVKAEVFYPADYIRKVNYGRIAIGRFDAASEITLAEKMLADALAGKDPFAERTGDLKRHYVFQEAGEIMPYRVYIPKAYKGERAYPLIVALHGNGGTEDSMFDGYKGELPRLAEEKGYIVVAPLGYRVDGGYNSSLAQRTAEDNRKLELSGKDVMNVLELMKRDYRIDENRIYLMGHSMGASGTWGLGPRYPNIWAALGPIAGRGVPETLQRIKHIPQFVIHGDADPTVPVEFSRTMVAEMKRLGIEHRYIEVAGGDHGNIAAPNFRAMFEFFDSHRKAPGK